MQSVQTVRLVLTGNNVAHPMSKKSLPARFDRCWTAQGQKLTVVSHVDRCAKEADISANGIARSAGASSYPAGATASVAYP